jgi:hypothetical protein
VICVNGTCTDDGICQCISTWTSPLCDERKIPNCSISIRFLFLFCFYFCSDFLYVSMLKFFFEIENVGAV